MNFKKIPHLEMKVSPSNDRNVKGRNLFAHPVYWVKRTPTGEFDCQSANIISFIMGISGQ